MELRVREIQPKNIINAVRNKSYPYTRSLENVSLINFDNYIIMYLNIENSIIFTATIAQLLMRLGKDLVYVRKL